MARPSRLLSTLNRIFAGLFLAFAVLQYNDPDPVGWMAIYAAAAAACLVYSRIPQGWLGAIPVGAVAAVWSALVFSGIDGEVALGDLFRSMEMTGGAVEEAREALGLLLVAGWMGVLVGAHLRKRT